MGVDAGGLDSGHPRKGKGESQESFSSILVQSLENPSKQQNIASCEMNKNNFMKKKRCDQIKMQNDNLFMLVLLWILSVLYITCSKYK